ncbi:MAG: glycosyltransferase [Desulfosporosinus sp.]|nr:glycosyltransferase [Desulfosporosinus sp.]
MSVVLKIVALEFTDFSRDKRELSGVKEMGHKVLVMAKGEKNEIVYIEGFEVHLRSTRPLGQAPALTRLNRIVSVFTWAFYARKLRPDCISGHDLTGLFIGWLSTWFIPKKKRPNLVYDAHEFEVGRHGKRSRFKRLLIPHAEKFFMKRCKFSIMVNDIIADMVQEAYKLKDRPVVARNMAVNWAINEKECEEKRREFCDKLPSPEKFLVMYHGGIKLGRGLETLLQVVQRDEHIQAILLGNVEEKYKQELRKSALELGIEDRILFHNAVPISELWKYVGAVDISMITIPASCQSYYYMLPNKFFESIQSLTPIIASDFPEVGKIVREYEIGLLVNPDSVEDIVAAVERLRLDKELYRRFKTNLKRAKEELCWEREKLALCKAYARVLD